MQGKHSSQQKGAGGLPGNIFQQTSGWLAGITDGARKNFEKTASLRSDEHHFDEALLIVKGLLFFCIIVTAGFGIYYHYSLFQNVAGMALIAGIMSGLLFLAAEVVKYIFGRYAIRAVFNGVWLRSWAHLGLSLCMAGIAIGGYWWSIEISTRAVVQMNEMTRTSELLAISEFSPTPAMLELDKQIAEAEATSAKSKESTWHKKPTAEGLAVMEQAEKTKLALLAQRQQLLDQALAEHNARQQSQQQEVSHTAHRIGTYGGWAEWLSIFLLFFLELLMQVCYRRNKTSNEAVLPESTYDQVTEVEEPETRHHVWNGIGFQAIRSRHETTPPPPAETKKPEQPETLVTTAFQRVSAPETKVIVSTEIRDDVEREIAEQIRRIQRYFSKWNNRGKGGGKPETIRQNIRDAFAVITKLQGQGGEISTGMKQKIAEHWNKYVTEIKNQKP